ncbi:uro-adherence factor A isoform X1 [Drosophila takahashii]|uniref:uro-adherence factor A isoform X1 n=1 Tax=Drosophila takahashii TaxID=29030 RepID=UPI0038992B50
MTEVEQPPQNGIDPTAGEDDDKNQVRPADIEQDMREMERRKRVEAIMGSKLFREELERIVDSARDGGAGASGILQQLSDIVGVPVSRVGSVFKSSNCMVPINDIRGVESMGYAKGEKILRCKLAATFRLLDLYGWTQGLGAQITARLKVDQEYFLVNPYGLLYHEITASALNKVDMQGQIVEQGTTNFGGNKSHFILHSVVHAARPDIRCAIYIGCSPVVAISSLKSGLLPLTKDACVLGEITTHAYTGLFDEEERNRLVRSLGPNSKVILLANHGALCCGETIEEAFFAACHIVQACETQLKLLPVGLDNLVLIPEESRKAIYDQSRRPPEDLEKKFAAVVAGEDGAAAAEKEATEAPVPKVGSPPKWRVGGAEFEALMRMLDNAGYRTGYIYRHPLIKSDPPKPKNDVELPPAVSSLGYLLEEEELFRQGIWKKGDLRKGGDRSRWLNSPNVYQKVEVLETGTPDPKKITKWVAEGSPTHSTPVRIEDPLQFVPAGTNPREFKRVQQLIKDNRRADKISAGPQSHILEGVTWDEASRLKDATVSQAGDHVVMMGAASKGIIQRGFQHNATVYKAPYAKNPFDNVTDDELNEYKRTVERKKKSVHGEYTDTDFSESEAVLQAGTKKYPQSEPETEHQVIEIQTQQAPVPRQAEVVLSDGDNNNHDSQIDKEDKEYQLKGRDRNLSANSRCRRDLFPSKGEDPISLPDQLYSYAYATAVSLGQCVQPQVCSALLRALHCEQLGSLASSYRGGAGASNATTSSTCTITSATCSSTASRRPLQQANMIYPLPYRTGSHFGFNSPRHQPRTEHKHMPKEREQQAMGYRPMQRGISYEEIFATPRYEQLCQACFDKLLRLKPELQRIGGGTAASSCADELTSAGSTPVQEMLMLPERPRIQRNAQTQTQACSASSSTMNFLSQIERFNFSEESTNVSYSPGLINGDSSLMGLVVEQATSSAGASATSAAPQRVYHVEQGDITEVWSFGRWLEPQEMMTGGQQPLTEHRITLEIKQNIPNGDDHVDRQLMTREERQRRKSEFQELWQDHVEYFGAKEQMQHEQENRISMTPDDHEARSEGGLDPQLEQGKANSEHSDNPQEETMTEPSDELPKILQKFEESLTVAGENLEKLVATTKKLQVLDTDTSGVTSSSSPEEQETVVDSGSLFRSISLDNIPEADDTVSLQEPDSVLATDSSINNGTEEDCGLHNSLEQEEKGDDEKPVSPALTEPEEPTEPSDKEKGRDDEKDIDENDLEVETVLQDTNGVSNVTDVPSLETDNQFFTPLEREILQRIEDERLDESEPIFGKIDHSIRNKMTPRKLQDLVSEEIFRTCTHVYPKPSTPLLNGAPPADTTLTPSGSSLSAHNISAPCSSMAHAHLVTRPTPRMSRSWSEDQQGRQEVDREESEQEEESPLGQIISSTTFVCRSSPRRKRNFIQENIRNASRPRSAAGSVKKHRSNKVTTPRAISSPSSVCAFQCGQRDSGARLWVSLPTPPRDKTTNPARTLYTVRGSLSSPFAKRRKPPVILPPLRRPLHGHSRNQNTDLNSSTASLYRTLSSSTFFVADEEHGNSDNISTSTFQMEGSQEDKQVDNDESQEELHEAAHDKANATNSSMYYSANDKTQEEGESSPSSAEAIEEISGDMQFKPKYSQEFIERTYLAESSHIPNNDSSSSLYKVEMDPENANNHVISHTQDTTDPETYNFNRMVINEQLSPIEMSSQDPEKPARLTGGAEALHTQKDVIPKDHFEEEEFNEQLISVVKANDDKDMTYNDEEPTTSKPAVETRKCASTEDEDAVTLDTVCIVHGLEMFVQEVVPMRQENSEEFIEFGGLFEDGLVEEDEEVHVPETVEEEID